MPLRLAGSRPANLGVHDGRLRDCPNSPNCVCSDASRAAQQVAPWRIAGSADSAWHAVRAAVAALPRTRVVRDTGEYLHAECSSPLLGFVDDLEIHLRASSGEIAVRSASRIGYSDLGTNRSRVEALQRELHARGGLAAD